MVYPLIQKVQTEGSQKQASLVNNIQLIRFNIKNSWYLSWTVFGLG